MTLKKRSFAFVDIETTGHSHVNDRIIDIAIIKIDSDNIIDTFQTTLNPGRKVPPFIENYTGIFTSDLEFSPTFDSVSDKILTMLEGSVFVAHNVNFDYNFIRSELLRCGLELRTPKMCSIRLAKNIYPGLLKYSLSSLIDKFEFQCENRHRAYDDAHVIWQFYQYAISELGQEVVEKAVRNCIEESYLPQKIEMETIDALPETPGVYIFYGENDYPLYVGKSINIKDRVKSHFYGGGRTEKELRISDQVSKINIIETAGELSALILESRLVKEMMPIYNKRLRRYRELVVAKKSKDESGYFTVELERAKKASLKNIDDLLGVFSSVKACKEFLDKKQEKYQLCSKLLGLEKVLSGCFKYHLGKCSGACVSKESPDDYNSRFTDAFSNESFDSWPFDNPIKITESLADSGLESTYIIDKWCLIDDFGTAEKSKVRKNILKGFDLDVYKILRSYIDKSPSNINISPA